MSLTYEPASEPPEQQSSIVHGIEFFVELSNVDRLPREQKMLKGHLPRVIFHQVYWYMKITFDYMKMIKVRPGTGSRISLSILAFQDSHVSILVFEDSHTSPSILVYEDNIRLFNAN